jgi:DNA-3-methyladenine glycosylase II
MVLALQDNILAQTIALQSARWPVQQSEDPIWGLVRIVIAQQISTRAACRIAERVKSAHPAITQPSAPSLPAVEDLRLLGLSERRARCCVNILQMSDEIREKIRKGDTWESALTGIKGIGPWTLAVFRIMVLREPDVLPLGDVGLERAIENVYGPNQDTNELAEKWRPYRSVACWYLWRTLGNEQLG